jgi:hypothetical protein
MIQVGGHECSANRESMRRERGIEILGSRAAAVQRRFDATVRVTDGIGPLGSGKLRARSWFRIAVPGGWAWTKREHATDFVSYRRSFASM